MKQRAGQLRGIVKALATENYRHFVIGGDTNMWEEENAPPDTNLRDVADEPKKRVTFDIEHNPIAVTTRKSYRFDRVFCTPDVSISNYDVIPFLQPTPTPDHYAICTTIALSKA